MNPKSCVVAVSGNGRSLANLCRQQNNKDFIISGVVSSSNTCKALAVAKENSIPTFVGDFSNQKKTNIDLSTWLSQITPAWIVLAGFLKKFPTAFAGLDYLSKKIINIHPSLLPCFGGKDMYGIRIHEQVLLSNNDITGATIHFVNNEYDQGKIIAQTKVPIAKERTSLEIANKVFFAECKFLPHVLKKLITGELPLSGSKIYTYKTTGKL